MSIEIKDIETTELTNLNLAGVTGGYWLQRKRGAVFSGTYVTPRNTIEDLTKDLEDNDRGINFEIQRTLG